MSCRRWILSVVLLLLGSFYWSTGCQEEKPREAEDLATEEPLADLSPDLPDQDAPDLVTDPDSPEDIPAEGIDLVDLADRLDSGYPSLEGTSLEGIQVQWEAELALCNRWPPGQSLEDAQAAQMRLILPPQERSGLEAYELEQARLEAVLVEKGPLSNERWRPATGDWSNGIRRYEISDPTGNTRLDAEIVHQLNGVGCLVEGFSVQRTRSDSTPVTYGADSEEVRFWFEPLDGPATIPLQSCGGSETWEDAVSVLAASNGDNLMTAIRFWRTRPDADGQPMVFDTTQIHVRGADWWFYQTYDYWAQIYSAGEEHLGERSVLDFHRDLFTYPQIVAYEQSGQLYSYLLEEVRFDNLNPVSGSASIQTTRIIGEGPPQQLTWTPVGDGYWRRVDESYLRRVYLDDLCLDGDVFYLEDWSSDTAWHLLLCPASGGQIPPLGGLVPIQLESEPAAIGSYVGPGQFTPFEDPPRSGYTTTIGWTRVELTFRDSQQTICITVEPPEVTQGQEMCFARSWLTSLGPPERYIMTLDAHSQDEAVAVTVIRATQSLMSAGGLHLTPVSLSLTFAGQIHVADAWDQLVYINTHHNWNDRFEGIAGNARLQWWVVSEWELPDPGDEAGMFVYAETLEGTVLLPTTEVFSD